MELTPENWRAVHENDLKSVQAILDRVLNTTDGVIATGLTWDLQLAIAHLNKWEEQSYIIKATVD